MKLEAKSVKNIAQMIKHNFALIELDLAWAGLTPLCNN